MTAREHAEKASQHIQNAETLPLGDGALPTLFSAAQAHALTALALAATGFEPSDGINCWVVDAGAGVRR